MTPPLPGIRPGDRVLVIGGYGVGNVGDEAMLGGLLRALPPGARAEVVSAAPQRTAALHGVRALAPPGLPGALGRCDVLLIGGGGLFGGHMGPRGRAIPFAAMAARALGRRIAVHGVSLDETTPRAHRPAVRWLVREAGAISVRDASSAALLTRWGVEAPVLPDLSEHLPAAPPQAAEAILCAARLDLRRPVVGLALGAVEPRFVAPLRAAVPALLRAFPDAQFCFVPMSRHPAKMAHNDLALGLALRRAAPGLAVIQDELVPAEAIALFAAFDAAICMRYHAMLFSARAGTPLIGIPYAPKCAAFLAERGLPSFAPYAPDLAAGLLKALERPRARVLAGAAS